MPVKFHRDESTRYQRNSDDRRKQPPLSAGKLRLILGLLFAK